VADFCGLESLVVIEPVCGPYYDHIGISKEVREGCYQKIRDEVANHPSARIADFSDREYEPYFLFDIVHFGCTGWVSAELSIYEFAEGGI
jgi:D-alanine transfer protein